MSDAVVKTINKYVREKGIPVLAVADAVRLNEKAPEGFRPKDYLPGARSVIIFGKPLPLEVYRADNDPRHRFYARAFSDGYRLMNEVTDWIVSTLTEKGFPSLPVPAYSPLKYHRGEPWGIMSFKHAAQEAGVGKIGKNTLLIHPDYGNILRFGGLITALALPAGAPKEYPKLCPKSCDLCERACPVGAIREGSINKTRCLTRCIDHTMLPSYPLQSILRWFGSKSGRVNSFMESFTISFFENYGIRCMRCLLACPHFPGR
jgi:epoxyqueuosine reductase